MGRAKEANKARRTKQYQRVRFNEQIDKYLTENNLWSSTGYGSNPFESGNTYPSTHKEKRKVVAEHKEMLRDKYSDEGGF